MKIQTARNATKSIVRMLVGLSVTYTVTTVIANNVDPESTTQKVEAYVGGAVIGMVVSNHVDGYTNRMVDGIFDALTGPSESE